MQSVYSIEEGKIPMAALLSHCARFDLIYWSPKKKQERTVSMPQKQKSDAMRYCSDLIRVLCITDRWINAKSRCHFFIATSRPFYSRLQTSSQWNDQTLPFWVSFSRNSFTLMSRFFKIQKLSKRLLKIVSCSSSLLRNRPSCGIIIGFHWSLIQEVVWFPIMDSFIIWPTLRMCYWFRSVGHYWTLVVLQDLLIFLEMLLHFSTWMMHDWCIDFIWKGLFLDFQWCVNGTGFSLIWMGLVLVNTWP